MCSDNRTAIFAADAAGTAALARQDSTCRDLHLHGEKGSITTKPINPALRPHWKCVTNISETPDTARVEALWFTCGHDPESGYYDVHERTAFVLVNRHDGWRLHAEEDLGLRFPRFVGGLVTWRRWAQAE